MKKRILLCTALLAMSCIIFSCEKEKGVNDSATESKVIAITETKEVDTTVAKKNVEIKNLRRLKEKKWYFKYMMRQMRQQDLYI